MTISKQLAALKQLSDLMLDKHLLALRSAQSARSETQARIQGLELPYHDVDCSIGQATRTVFLYEKWADLRRKEMNMVLARQTVTEIEAKDAARIAFSKQSILANLLLQQKRRN